MVEIATEVTEINDTKARQIGIKWTDTILAGEISRIDESRIPSALPEVPSIIRVGEWSRFTALSAELKLLQDKGAAQILSKPKLVTKSGTSAKVIVGGEVPIVASGVGGGSIQWKEFGIKMEILPKVAQDDFIDLVLTTEISRLDWTNQVNGNPAIMKREANANVRIKSGQTLALAGMLESTKQEQTSGLPLLSDIPFLGALFGRKYYNDTKTNILVFVTPRILE